MGTVSGSGDYEQDTVVTIHAVANAGYFFKEWHDGITQNPRTVTVTQDTIFIAIFETLIEYHVEVIADNPIMGTVTGEGYYQKNTTVTIQATPNPNYHFKQWKDGNTNNPRSITVTQDTTFTAIFDTIRYELLLTSNDPPRGRFSGNGTYAVNSVVTITATPRSAYRFVFWDDGNRDSMRTLTITRNITLTAIFGINSMYFLYAISNNTNMGTVIGGGDYAENATATITAMPNPGYRFVQWNDGNRDNPRMITLTHDTTLVATFEAGVGITDIETSKINVYPNPVRDKINIVLPENVYRAVFTLYDMQGKALIEQQISNQDVVSVSHLAKGIYIYNVRTEKENHTGKIAVD
jgi:hypothetical protein